MVESNLIYPSITPLNIDRYATILSTGIAFPQNIVTNNDIIQKYDLFATDRAVQYSAGIRERRWDNEGLLPSDLLAQAATQCLQRANLPPEKLDKILYARLIGDRIVPATAIKVLEKLKIKKGLQAFDISAACSGFMHALDMAIRYIDAGDDYILILAGGIASRSANKNNKKDNKVIFLIGDGVSAMLLGPCAEKHFFCSYIYCDNSYYNVAYIPFGTELLNKSKEFNNEMFNMQMKEGKAVHDATVESAYIVATKLLEESHLTIEDIDLFITSDQTTFIWEDELKKLNIPKEKSLSLFHKYGNTVAAMSPSILDELISKGKLKRGMTVLMMAHGAGSSGAGMIFQY